MNTRGKFTNSAVTLLTVNRSFNLLAQYLRVCLRFSRRLNQATIADSAEDHDGIRHHNCLTSTNMHTQTFTTSQIFEDFDRSLLLKKRINVLGRGHRWQGTRFLVVRRAVVGTIVLIGIVDKR
ncbi:hypothetical protein DFH07DRAFT_944332 [Mycena maculata]|uniref:Uncharacterized protein n=1 Tax=Mycena maculata TaxID=230809 RepID=A0AAD7I7D2_9AGAR|nr:hypothetical protein DFH07DRAFT_944332 [Mycena maculata]